MALPACSEMLTISSTGMLQLTCMRQRTRNQLGCLGSACSKHHWAVRAGENLVQLLLFDKQNPSLYCTFIASCCSKKTAAVACAAAASAAAVLPHIEFHGYVLWLLHRSASCSPHCVLLLLLQVRHQLQLSALAAYECTATDFPAAAAEGLMPSTAVKT
jgi:hypothetical protein